MLKKTRLFCIISAIAFTPFLALAQNKTLATAIDVIVGYFSLFLDLMMGAAVVIFVWFVIKYYILPNENRTQANAYMMWAIIGFFVILSMWGLVNVVSNTFKLDQGSPTSWSDIQTLFPTGGGSSGSSPSNAFNQGASGSSGSTGSAGSYSGTSAPNNSYAGYGSASTGASGSSGLSASLTGSISGSAAIQQQQINNGCLQNGAPGPNAGSSICQGLKTSLTQQQANNSAIQQQQINNGCLQNGAPGPNAGSSICQGLKTSLAAGTSGLPAGCTAGMVEKGTCPTNANGMSNQDYLDCLDMGYTPAECESYNPGTAAGTTVSASGCTAGEIEKGTCKNTVTVAQCLAAGVDSTTCNDNYGDNESGYSAEVQDCLAQPGSDLATCQSLYPSAPAGCTTGMVENGSCPSVTTVQQCINAGVAAATCKDQYGYEDPSNDSGTPANTASPGSSADCPGGNYDEYGNCAE